MTMQRDPGTGFEVETEIVWSRVLGVLLAFGLLMAAIYWLFGGSTPELENQASAPVQQADVPAVSATAESSAPTSGGLSQVTTAATAQPAPLANSPSDEVSPDTAAADDVAQESTTPTAVPPTPAPSVSQSRTAPTRTPARATAPPSAGTSESTRTVASADAGGAASGNYTVRPKETLQSIAKRVFGDESQWIYIAQANPNLKPNALRTGAKLQLPDVSTLTKQRQRHWEQIRKTLETPGAAAQTVTVHPGENLSVLAERAYGNAAKWHHIAAANRSKIHDPMKIDVGTVLVIPPAPK